MKNIMTRDICKNFVHISKWVPEARDIVFSQVDNYILAPVSKYFDTDNTMDYFSVRSKKVYNKIKVRTLCVHTLNYFEKFYDTDKELLSVYAKIKFLIDCVPEYNKDALFYDLHRLIINSSFLRIKMDYCNLENFIPVKTKFNGNDMSLYYNNNHICVMMRVSLTMKLIIPLLTHFAYKKKVTDIDKYLLEIFKTIIQMYEYEVDLYSKFYETCSTNISKNQRTNNIWKNQDIRSINSTTHTLFSINNIILNIMPKYIYDNNPVTLNYASIGQGIKYKVTDIGYDFSYTALSTSARDAQDASEMDKFESYLAKADESLYIQNKVNGESTMERIKVLFGPFREDEIEFYRRRLIGDGNYAIQSFQKELVFNLFYKYFGDTTSIKAINETDYIILLITASRICKDCKMRILPYIFSSRVIKYTSKKGLNKKESDKVIKSPYYKELEVLYNTHKATDKIYEFIGTILASEFEIIDYPLNYSPEDRCKCLNGLIIPKMPDIIINEVLMFASLIP